MHKTMQEIRQAFNAHCESQHHCPRCNALEKAAAPDNMEYLLNHIEYMEIAIECLRDLAYKLERECRNELVRGKIQGFSSDGPHSQLWNNLRSEILAVLSATETVFIKG